MLITRLKLENWRNFRTVDITLGPRVYIIGANASGKSNLLEVFRFLRTVAQREGGGLQKAVREGLGLAKLRSLHARKYSDVRIQVEISESHSDPEPTWIYALAFNAGPKGSDLVRLTEERVWHRSDGSRGLARPNRDDKADPARLTQTCLEQVNDNRGFREVVDHLAATTYLHLVPQLLKHADEISGRLLERDPFGQGLLDRIARTNARTREARLRRVEQSLSVAVPQFSNLEFEQDRVTGRPHLRVKFAHWRKPGAWQREDQFSDGTLRLLGLLWALQEGDGLLLLEEPELSLNEAIASHIPALIDRVLRGRSRWRQVLVSTHSEALVESVGDPSQVVLIEPGADGSSVRGPNDEELRMMRHGLNAAEVMLPKARPEGADQLGLGL